MKRNFLLLLLAAPVVGFLAVKLYVHVQVGNTVEMLISQARPVADISYGRVTSDVEGRVGLSEVVVRPAGINDQVRIGEVSIKLPSLLYVLRLEDRVSNQDLPTSLSLEVHDVTISTHGDLAAGWEAAMFEGDPGGRQRAFDNCVTRTSLPTQMYLLDYDQIRGSLEAGYYYHEESGNLVLHGQAGQIDGVSFRGELGLVVDSFDLASLGRTLSNPEIARAAVEISDAGYFQRLYRYCENDSGMPREAVVAMLAEELLTAFDGLPMKPDEPLMAAYTEFVSGASRIVFTAEPREPKKLQYLSLYDPVDVPAVLNINAQVH